ncbi:MAG: phosphoribosylformylglycinamidine cyclo-ligase [Eubacteriales bacterium]|nr:phosphoribosylformylglycinamidine cyclo-ligase [Eubacteriales bacterium]
MQSNSDSYKAAGVDITAGYKAVQLMQSHIARTKTPGVLSPIGGFGGLFMPDIAGMEKPVLVSGTDGVGTKLKLAFLLDKHDTIGIDCVAMCVNDIICCGAKPLFFLDYLALSKNVPEQVAKIVSGVAQGCVQSGAALIGGETAEMPGFYQEGEYDIAGFAVGMVDQKRAVGPHLVQEGDVLIALPSSGAHSNGYSLIRKVFGIENDAAVLSEKPEELNCTLGEALITPTKIYVKAMLPLVEAGILHAAAHITGGGFYENIPRALPAGLTAKIEKRAVQTPALFHLIAKRGGIPERDMYNTFNMGVGMCLCVAKARATEALTLLQAAGEAAYIMGSVERKEGGVTLC